MAFPATNKYDSLLQSAIIENKKTLYPIDELLGLITEKDKGLHFHLACHYGRVEIVETFINYFEKINKKEIINTVFEKTAPLHETCAFTKDPEIAKGQFECASILLKRKNIDIDVLDKEGNNALFYAAANGKIDMLELFLKKKAKVNQTNQRGEIALAYMLNSTENDTNIEPGIYSKCAALLIEKGSNLQWTDKEGKTLLHLAAREGKVGCIPILVKKKIKVNIQDSEGNTPLLVTSVAAVSVLLQQKGIDVNITNSTQKTSLHHVAGLDNAEEAILGLISHGANVNAKDRSGCTPLHMAAINGRLGNIKILMSNGADASITSNVNETARTIAESNGHVFVVDFFDKPPISPISPNSPNSPNSPSIGGKAKEPEVKDDSKSIIKNKENKAEAKLAEKESQIADLELEIARLQSETMALQIKIEQQEQQNTVSSTQIPDLQQKLKVTQGETSKMKEEFDNYKTQMQTQISERQVEITKIKEESTKWKEEEAKLREENEDLKNKLRRSNTLVAEIKQQVDQKIKSRTDMENSLAKQEEENIKLFKDREDLLVLQSKFKLTWVPDDFVNECLICNIKFTVTSRKHHCRLCGRIYCGKCADKKAQATNLTK